jgi:hypothetical protein
MYIWRVGVDVMHRIPLKMIWLFVVLAGVLIVANADIVMAISNASVSGGGPQARWAGNISSAGTNTTQGGNITAINIASYSLTNKWADFYGNVSGAISLGDSSGVVYSWAWSTTSGGTVCLSTNASFPFSSAHNMTNGTGIDLAWGFTTTDSDSANNTFGGNNSGLANANKCNLNFTQTNITGTANVSLQGSSTFTDCLIGANSSAITSGQTYNLAFCTPISSSGTNYRSVPSNFEVMVATSNVPGVKTTYYFYAELD